MREFPLTAAQPKLQSILDTIKIGLNNISIYRRLMQYVKSKVNQYCRILTKIINEVNLLVTNIIYLLSL